MTEVANIYPPDIQRRLLHARERPAVAAIRHAADSSCRGLISPAYIHHAFNNFKEGFVYTQEGAVVAFCIWKIRMTTTFQMVTHGELFILLVCSVPQPFSALDMILFDIERHCRERGIRTITLEPANDALRAYYQAKGFNTMDTAPERMAKVVDTPIQFNQSRRYTTRRRQRTSVHVESNRSAEPVPLFHGA